MSVLSFSVPTSFSIENLDKSLSYAEKRCDNGSCRVTTCFEDKPCSIDDSNDSPTKTTNPHDKVRQLFGSSDIDSDLKNMEFMDVFDDLFDFN
jgi:hypothetical protein